MITKIKVQCVVICISLLSFMNCSNERSDIKFISSGGVTIKNTTCPTSYNDVIIPLTDLKLPTPKGEPEMTITGVFEFMEENSITTIPQLLNRLPKHFRNNFSLVEETRGEGQSNISFPRIVLFGPDGRFLMNISTKPEDPKYNLLDCAFLDDETGDWEFSQLDFTQRKPKLIRNPEECQRCHGKKNPRPVWGTSQDWPGVFGDNDAPGMTGDALAPRHLKRMNEIRNGHGGSNRFDFLEWREDEDLKSGGFRKIADNAFGVELLVSNLLMGSASARGSFLNIKNKYPERYEALRAAMILLTYDKYEKEDFLTQEQKQSIEELISSYGVSGDNLDAAFAALGVDTKEAFSLATLAEEEPPRTDWRPGDGDMYEQVMLQVLEDLSKSDQKVRSILETTMVDRPVFQCDETVKSVQEMVDFKMLYMYHLQGEARYKVNKVFYPLEVERVYDIVLAPVKDQLSEYLLAKI